MHSSGEIKMRIITKHLEELNPAHYNPRKDLKPGDPEYEKLKKSIIEFDYIDPIVWNERTGRVVGGHQRLKILRELGHEQIEVSVVDLPEEKEKALNLALNKTGGDWDLPKLKDLLVELDVDLSDIEITGFDENELEELISQFRDPIDVAEDDFDVEEEVSKIDEPITKPGDIWQLGRHRLMCGDATVRSDVDKLMAGKLAHMVFTDPPYNVDYSGKTKDALKIKNDKMGDDEFYKFLFDAFANMFAFTAQGRAVYICHADSEGLNFRRALIESGWLLKQCIIWAKNSIVMGRQDYHWQHEPILYGWKPGASHQWFGGRKEATVWNFNKPLRNAEHPTIKPVGIPARAIQNSSKENEIILDLFGGSGSTLIAAEQIERIAYLMELDPVYCDVIVKRWEQSTGQKVERLE